MLPLCLFDVTLPTLDIYSDLSLVIPWYLASHWKYATCMSIPLILQFSSTIYKWIQIEKPKRKKWSWILLLLQVWPQWRAFRVMILLHKNAERAQNKKQELLREISSTEPFLEAWPSILIMTIIWVQAGSEFIVGDDNIDCTSNYIKDYHKNFCAVYSGFGGIVWFFTTYAISVFTGALGITKFLQTGPCSVLSEEGPLGGILKWKFIITYLSVMCSLITKGLFIALFVGANGVPLATNFFGTTGHQYALVGILIMLFFLIIVPNVIISFICIGLATRISRNFFKLIFRYPAIWLLPAVTYFVIGPRELRCCKQNENNVMRHQLGVSKCFSLLNLLMTVMMYGTMIALFLTIPDQIFENYWLNYFMPYFPWVFCLGIIFTIIFLLLDESCCFSGSQKCLCTRCCGPDCYKFQYQYINVNHDDNQLEIWRVD